MTLEGVDYSYSRPSPARLAAAGKRFAGRYISDPGPGNKGISQAEYDHLTAEGIAVVFVWENGATSAKLGYARGVTDAKHAQRNLNALNGPSNQRPIYFAVDYDETNPSRVKAYFQGVVSVIGKRRAGVYGSGLVIDYLFAERLVSFGWHAAASWAWGGGHKPAAAHVALSQYRVDTPLVGAQVDLVRAFPSNYGQKAVIFSKPAPKPASAPVPIPIEHIFYTVQTGDTLTAIAAKYDHSVSTIAGWNGITDPNRINVGQKLRVS